jgi:L-rhamnose 1-dehydrogenase
MISAGRLKGKRVIITGASRGIGRAIAIGFAFEGAELIINFPARKEKDEARKVISEIKRNGGNAFAIKADVSKIKEVQTLVERSVDLLGGIDALVNNAGICPWFDFLQLPMHIWEQTQAVNHRGVFLCSQVVAKQMVGQKTGGSIITIGSVGAHTGGPRQTHYNASKAAIGSLMRSAAVALGKYGIRCNVILPGCIRTAMNQKELDDPVKEQRIVEKTPLGRIGVPDDIVGAAIFFAADESKFCTGTELRIDGGISINV